MPKNEASDTVQADLEDGEEGGQRQPARKKKKKKKRKVVREASGEEGEFNE